VPRSFAVPLVIALLVVGCSSPRPVLYPNERYKELGDPAAQEIVNSCMQAARDADVADSRTTGAAKGATFGGAVGAVIGGAVGWIFGNPGRGAAAGAAAGGGRGAVDGASKSGEGAQTYRGYVEVCLRRESLETVGWR
jgi:outer membrane lipoprotein SlyB